VSVSREADLRSTERASVVITTRNSASTLERLFESIEQQIVRAEVIVVDNESTDDTLELAARHADVVRSAGPERSAQRNVGTAAATTEYVLHVDSDMVLEPQTIAECLKTADETGAGALIIPETSIGESLLARVRSLERSCYECDDTIEAPRFFRREVLVAHGGYDEELFAGEDWDLAQRLRLSGVPIARAYGARLLHDDDATTLPAHLQKKYYYGHSLGRYVKRHPSLGARQVSPVRPAFVRHRRRLAAHPALAAAVVLLKMTELLAGGAGFALAEVGKLRPSLRPAAVCLAALMIWFAKLSLVHTYSPFSKPFGGSWLTWAFVSLALFALAWIAPAVALLALGRKQDARAVAGFVPDVLILARGLVGDERVPRRRKLLLIILAAYIAMPFDPVPDVIPILGQLDDAIVAVLVLRVLLKAGGEPLVRSHWPGPESSLRVLLRLARG
jgi:glycosyltransferase involved in cell wall biosynthesis/uncharacterized membrane protein YkvA (DUF1232 family)